MTGVVTALSMAGSLCYMPVVPESRVMVEGRTTLGSFRCESHTLEGRGLVHEGTVQGWLVIPVKSLDCGNEGMNRDLQNTLKANRYPEIRFEVEGVEDVVQDGQYAAHARALGRLFLAGVTREESIPVEGELLQDGRVRVRGWVSLRLSDFAITPPSVLWGLVRVHDEITVIVDLVGRNVPVDSCWTQVHRHPKKEV